MKNASFYFAIVCCIISQIFIALDMGGSGMLKLSWLLPFAFFLFSGVKIFFNKTLLPYYVFLIVFVFYCVFCEAFTSVSYIGADVNNICISISILAISYAYGKQNQNFEKSLTTLALLFFVASFAYGIVVYIKFLMGADMYSIIYAYDDKNSAAQIFLSASIILFTLYKPLGSVRKLTMYSFIAILLYIMIILKSRATLVGFFFVISYFAFVYKNKKVRYIFLGGILVIVIYILLNPSLYRTVVEGILFANRDSSDLNSLSSGRFDQMDKCIDLFLSSPLIGIGNKYFDCFPVIILTQYGIFGAVIIFTFLRKRIKECYCLLDKTNKLDLCAFLLMITYLLDCLFEAQPPFGPGVKCLPLWMVWGIMLSKKHMNKSENF